MAEERALFAAGCFWGVEEAFRKLPGVMDTKVGYTGGETAEPTYKDVCRGDTGHAETVEVVYDPEKVSYDALLNVFWDNHDPTTVNRQGPDIGTQYRSAIFYTTPQQQQMAAASKTNLEASKRFARPIATQIQPASQFYMAEDYHQQYFAKRGLVH